MMFPVSEPFHLPNFPTNAVKSGFGNFVLHIHEHAFAMKLTTILP